MARELLAVLLSLAVLSSSCASPTEPGGTPPVLSEAIVDLSQIVRFIPFGAALPGSGVTNPAYELVVTGASQPVRAATAGTVTRVESQGDDFELHVSVPGTDYLVIYDHVRNVAMVVGQTVAPGTLLGTVGPWSPGQGRVELQINRGNESVCPRDLGTPGFNAAHDAALAAADPAQQAPGWTSVCLAAIVRP